MSVTGGMANPQSPPATLQRQFGTTENQSRIGNRLSLILDDEGILDVRAPDEDQGGQDYERPHQRDNGSSAECPQWGRKRTGGVQGIDDHEWTSSSRPNSRRFRPDYYAAKRPTSCAAVPAMGAPVPDALTPRSELVACGAYDVLTLPETAMACL
jgi:hypothetical protein